MADILWSTDNLSLKYLWQQTIHTPQQHQRLLLKLRAFDFDIVYKTGRENLIADALSRQFSDEQTVSTECVGAMLYPLTTIKPDSFEFVRKDCEESE